VSGHHDLTLVRNSYHHCESQSTVSLITWHAMALLTVFKDSEGKGPVLEICSLWPDSGNVWQITLSVIISWAESGYDPCYRPHYTKIKHQINRHQKRGGNHWCSTFFKNFRRDFFCWRKLSSIVPIPPNRKNSNNITNHQSQKKSELIIIRE